MFLPSYQTLYFNIKDFKKHPMRKILSFSPLHKLTSKNIYSFAITRAKEQIKPYADSSNEPSPSDESFTKSWTSKLNP